MTFSIGEANSFFRVLRYLGVRDRHDVMSIPTDAEVADALVDLAARAGKPLQVSYPEDTIRAGAARLAERLAPPTDWHYALRCTSQTHRPADPLWVTGDRDRLAQLLAASGNDCCELVRTPAPRWEPVPADVDGEVRA